MSAIRLRPAPNKEKYTPSDFKTDPLLDIEAIGGAGSRTETEKARLLQGTNFELTIADMKKVLIRHSMCRKC
jgi:hypothetical protein